MKLYIVGLGNPRANYGKTLHNAGANWLLWLADQFGGDWQDKQKFHGRICDIAVAETPVQLLIPNTYMNDSGTAVAAWLKNTPVQHDKQLLVVHDELDLPAGTNRIKYAGSTAGHNGLKDINAKVDCVGYHKLRIGVRTARVEALGVNPYLLTKAPAKVWQTIESTYEQMLSGLHLAISGDWSAAMQEVNTIQKI